MWPSMTGRAARSTHRGGDWRGVFEPLRDPVFFAKVALDEELGTISWPNGADVAPETLHLWISAGRDRLSA